MKTVPWDWVMTGLSAPAQGRRIVRLKIWPWTRLVRPSLTTLWLRPGKPGRRTKITEQENRDDSCIENGNACHSSNAGARGTGPDGDSAAAKLGAEYRVVE